MVMDTVDACKEMLAGGVLDSGWLRMQLMGKGVDMRDTTNNKELRSPMEKFAWNCPKWCQEFFFLLIQTLPMFWAERILILSNFIFWISWDSQISRFLGPRFPDFQKSGLGQTWARLGPGLGRAGPIFVYLGYIWIYPFRGPRIKQNTVLRIQST